MGAVCFQWRAVDIGASALRMMVGACLGSVCLQWALPFACPCIFQVVVLLHNKACSACQTRGASMEVTVGCMKIMLHRML
jgi:hypothetical protein